MDKIVATQAPKIDTPIAIYKVEVKVDLNNKQGFTQDFHITHERELYSRIAQHGISNIKETLILSKEVVDSITPELVEEINTYPMIGITRSEPRTIFAIIPESGGYMAKPANTTSYDTKVESFEELVCMFEIAGRAELGDDSLEFDLITINFKTKESDDNTMEFRAHSIDAALTKYFHYSKVVHNLEKVEANIQISSIGMTE